ncbi:uncharacterized protein KNAG_0J01830 [Huiozyma naganishii CBS 8797]|uniref:Uncharacterized protein n=1 Tax=Huiozyma naganishii (strain ATCC MYA-139 / BCRC 22969 / CBS 8797 / KCTC 17520 / NBRC 10181 / NCYC 3082 / Yp74L-3) TaxID=1071383 RepID=J7S9S0_HUIN7|nr:hypothetical protein KNAG_0J01830 [Kazachstania naganishii CBS 8797]CCK72264.1 hypothetical protein KNAG_0J01830 [Kazachstania naganishii CBS 8797]
MCGKRIALLRTSSICLPNISWSALYLRGTIPLRNYHNNHGNKSLPKSINMNTDQERLDTLFNAKLPKKTVVNQFKKILREKNHSPKSVKGDKPVQSHFDKLSTTIVEKYGSKRDANNGTRSTGVLYQLILQNRIKDDQLYEGIVSFASCQTTNVAEPNKVDIPQSSKRTGPIKSIPLDIHKSKNVNIEQILDRLERQLLKKSHKTNELYQVLSNIIEEADEFSNKPRDHDVVEDRNINILALERYLKKVEEEKEQKQHVIREQEKIYNWNQFAQENKPLLAGQSVLQRYFVNSNPFTKMVKGWNRLFDSSKVNTTASNEEFMIYDMKRGEESLLKNKDGRIPYNLGQRGYLGIVNSSHYTPDEISAVVKKYENNSWVLVGNIYNANEKLVFKKLYDPEKKGPESRKVKNIVVFILLLLVPATLYKKSMARVEQLEGENDSNSGN